MAACTFKSEEHEELLDALSRIYDQLESLTGMAWWILEILPLRHLEQDRKDFFVGALLAVCLSPPIPSVITHVSVIFLHRVNWAPRPSNSKTCWYDRKERKFLCTGSVKTRMDADCLKTGKYNPRANFEHYEVEWVD